MDGDAQRGGSAGPSPGPRLVDATLLDHLGDGICVLDGSWSFVLVNEVAARMVGGAGYRVLVASDGVEAPDVLDRNDDVALVLSDLVMPRLRGDELAAT